MRKRTVAVLLAATLSAGMTSIVAAPPAQAGNTWTYRYSGSVTPSQALDQARNWVYLAARVGAGCAASTFINSTIKSLSRPFSAGWSLGNWLVTTWVGADSACTAAKKMAYAAYYLCYSAYRTGATQTYRVWVLREDVWFGPDRCQYYVWVAGRWRVGGSTGTVSPITTGRPPSGCFGE
jgi:hypothetical protein